MPVQTVTSIPHSFRSSGTAEMHGTWFVYTVGGRAARIQPFHTVLRLQNSRMPTAASSRP